MSQEITHLTQPLNFDTWTERASSAGKLNSNPAGKTPMQKYQDAIEDIAELNEKAKVKPLIASQLQKLSDLKYNLKELEAHKDDIILSATAKSHLKSVYWTTRTGIKPSFFSKYTENGKIAEPDGIKLISELDDPDLFEMGSPVYEKCELPRQFNNHFQGECDIKKSPRIQDIKICWDVETYYPHINELIFSDGETTKWFWSDEECAWILPANNIENDIYECQGVVYMELYGESEFWLRYCLVDMPTVLLEQEYRKIKFQIGEENEVYYKAIEEFKSKHQFSHLPIQSRVCTFKIKRNVELYQSLCKKVEVARKYLNWYSEEMFYFENPQLRPKNLLEKKLETLISEKEYSDIAKEFENLEKNIEDEISEQFKPVEDQIQEEDRIREELGENADKVLTEVRHEAIETVGTETLFPNSLDDIKPEQNENRIERIERNIKTKIGLINSISELKEYHEFLIKEFIIKDDENYQDINQCFSNREIELKNLFLGVKPIQSENEAISNSNTTNSSLDERMEETQDTFLASIQALQKIEDAVEFYMENSDKIDDTKYEQAFYAKKEALSVQVEAPKIKKPIQEKPNAPSQSTSPKFTPPIQPEKVYTGDEKYDISDGVNILQSGLNFLLAKDFILQYLKNKFSEWNTYQLHRDNITSFYQANKEVIERDLSFKEVVSNLSKAECSRLIEIRRKEMLEQVSKM